MGYRYRIGREGIDIIVPTKKGIEIGGMPKGVIIPVGQKHRPEVLRCLEKASDAGFNIYIAKHCDDPQVLTHIVPNGIVNRFGWYLTNEDILSVKPDWCLDVGGPGWFKRVTISRIEEIEKYLKKRN